jgi:hypothetical protein
MESTANMLTTQNNEQKNNTYVNNLKNKGFYFLETLFYQNGWHLIKNEINWICFTKPGFETEYFEIKIDSDKIFVSIPIKNSIFQYRTSFKDYYTANEYIENRLNEFII